MVVETTTFRLAADVDQDAFLTLDRRVQNELIPNQPGFARRTTTHRDGAWLVVTLWWSEQHAAAFEQLAGNDPIQAEFESCFEAGTKQVNRYDTLD